MELAHLAQAVDILAAQVDAEPLGDGSGAVAVVAMVYWLGAIGITGLVAIVLAVLNSCRSLTLTSSR